MPAMVSFDKLFQGVPFKFLFTLCISFTSGWTMVLHKYLRRLIDQLLTLSWDTPSCSQAFDFEIFPKS